MKEMQKCAITGDGFLLLMALSVLSSSFYLLTRAQEVANMNTPEYIFKDSKLGSDVLDEYIDARLEGKKLKSNILSHYIDARIDLLRLEFGAVIKSYMGAIGGGLTLGLFIATWFWPGRNTLIVKGLRMLISLSENEPKDKIS